MLTDGVSVLGRQQRFGIVQGGVHRELRRRHIAELSALPFDGYALGGFAVGEPIPVMYELLDELADELPRERPRYLMGVGTPRDLVTRHRRRHRHVRLRDADAQRPQRDSFSPRRARSTSATPAIRSTPDRSIRSARARPAPVTAGPTCATCASVRRSCIAVWRRCIT